MNGKTLSALLVLAFPALSFAQDNRNYQCTFGDLVRRVEIVSEAGASVPCEVHYYKDTEMPGERQVLWSATNEAGYCESNTQAFIARLQGWGWDCGQAVASPAIEPSVPEDDMMPMDEPMPVDDTDDLAPVEETDSKDDQ